MKWAWIMAAFFLASACKNISDIKAFTEAKYTLQDITSINVNSINLSDKNRLDRFSFSEMATLYNAFNKNELLADAVLALNVELQNPGSREVTVTQLKWQLLVDDKETLSGLVDEPVQLREGLNTIPVRTPLMVTKIDGQRNFEGLMQLVNVLSSKGADRSNVVLQIKPTVQTSVGNVESPNFITVYRPKSK